MGRPNKGYQHTKQALEAFNTAIDNFDLNTVPANVDERLHKASYEALISVRDELAEELDKYRIAMGPTDDQIIAEATRRRTARGQDGNILDRYVIEVMRENWKPHEPVDPDVLEFRVWGAAVVPSEAHRYLGGKYDAGFFAQAFLAGARMAREQERERADMPIRMAEELVGRLRSLLHSLPLQVRDQFGVKWELDEAFANAALSEIEKYARSMLKDTD